MAPWVPADLRKTMRSGLSELGVPGEVNELMISHGPQDGLVKVYNRVERWPERVAAARRWALQVCKSARSSRKPPSAPEGRPGPRHGGQCRRERRAAAALCLIARGAA
jgi:hypothetical protein